MDENRFEDEDPRPATAVSSSSARAGPASGTTSTSENVNGRFSEFLSVKMAHLLTDGRRKRALDGLPR